MTWLGLDIGGANLKAADTRGWARSVPFALWRDPGGLADAIGRLIKSAPHYERLAVTMTGELCDCFRTKAEGVRLIVAAAQRATAQSDVRIYCVPGRFVTVEEAQRSPDSAAAGNWHALAQFACRYATGMFGLLIDVGSTTTDIIPLSNSGPCPIGLSDTDRLLSGELVYTGVGRTPVCAITRSLPWRGKRCPVAAEYFATSADAYVILGQLAERADMNATADGRPLTKEFAHERLARMFCADASAFSKADAEVVAGAVREAQEGQLEAALRQVGNSLGRNPEWLVFSGTGEFLALSLAQRMFPAAVIISLAQRLGNDLSEAAPAYAVAVLAGEMG